MGKHQPHHIGEEPFIGHLGLWLEKKEGLDGWHDLRSWGGVIVIVKKR